VIRTQVHCGMHAVSGANEGGEVYVTLDAGAKGSVTCPRRAPRRGR
jgi:hypothetical protein